MVVTLVMVLRVVVILVLIARIIIIVVTLVMVISDTFKPSLTDTTRALASTRPFSASC